MVDEYDEFGLYDGMCIGCDIPGRINDMGLCEDCAGKLERDLIRQRAWDYSGAAFGLSADQREALRRQVVKQFGKALELIAPSGLGPSQRKRQHTKRKNGRR